MADAYEILNKFLEIRVGANNWTVPFASNAVLEWKGVTVKGRSRIVKFLRHKQQDGLVQRFNTAHSVAAFEERETHLSTMRTPPENLLTQPTSPAEAPSSPDNHCTTKSTSPGLNISFETPPRVPRISSEPPPLTEGHRFLPFTSSDEEEDESQSNQDSHSPDHPRQNMYSELQYLEAVGVVRSSRESKHRGTRTTHHIPRDDSPPPPDVDSISVPSPSGSTGGDHTDKRTKLKLSYRKHVETQEPQFALIIYEDLSPRSSKVRRNLFSDDRSQVGTEPPDSPEPEPLSASPEARALAATPPPVPSSPPAEVTPPDTPLEPPGTPHRRRRIPPAGMQTSPRRSRTVMNFTISTDEDSTGGSSMSHHHHNNNSLQTWPRKTHSTGSPGGSVAKNRKLATSSSSVRKPLRF